MIYLGQYYEDKGYNTDLNIPRSQLDDYSIHQYRIVIVNNITKNIVSQSDLINDSSSDYYYKFSDFDTTNLSDGEYTLSLYSDDNLVYDGLLSFRNAPKADVSVYNTTTKYIV